jgi:hypothetical protein
VLLVKPDRGGEDLELLLARSGLQPLVTDHDPVVELFNGVDGLVGCPGYNLFHEAAAAGVPAAWVWRGQSYDQRARCPTPVTDADHLAAWAGALTCRQGRDAAYVNGAARAAAEVAALGGLSLAD